MMELEKTKALYIRANDAYHNTDSPIMTDDEFDVLKQTLIAQGVYTAMHTVGAAPIGTTFKHRVPMLSLSNVFTDTGLYAFLRGVGTNSVTLEDKLDGLACSITYDNGVLIMALTRGDGTNGEDIMSKVRYMSTVPQVLPDAINLEVRGELVIDWVAFHEINAELSLENKPLLKSPRNAAVGAIKRKGQMTPRGVKFIAYGWIGLDVTDDTAGMTILKGYGFETVWKTDRMSPHDHQTILAIAQERLHEQTPVQKDGIVIKVDSIDSRNKLGMNNSSPNWAIAYKENSAIADTQLMDVIWQLGRTGAITPVGCLTPMELSGATIDRVTLHNYDEIRRLDLGILDTIRIVRSGQVIPKVTSVTQKADQLVGRPIEKPTNCPECGRPLKEYTDGAIMRCEYALPNELEHICKGVAVAKLVYACSKEAVEIKGVSQSIIQDLYYGGHIGHIWDLYSDSMCEHLANRHPQTATMRLPHYTDLIKSSRKCEIHRAVMALNIPMTAEITAKKLAIHIAKLTDLITHSPEQLGLSGVRATLFKEYIQHPYIQRTITELDQILTYILPDSVGQSLSGKSYVVTGSFDNGLSRREIEQYILKNGGKLQSTVNSKTDALIVGHNAGSKLKSAQTLGVPTYTRDEFMEMVNVP